MPEYDIIDKSLINRTGQKEGIDMKKSRFYRGLFYIIGLLILAFGITLNTKTGLGVSPIISVSYSISTMLQLNFGDITFLLYVVFVVIELILHFAMSKRSADSGKYTVKDLKKVILGDLLQIPLCLFFTRFMNIFSYCIPELSSECQGTFAGTMAGRFFFLLLAVICTGVGAVWSLDMRLVPNPGDGIVQAISDFTGKSVGFVKNCFDAFNICFTVIISILFEGKLIGIGPGTVIAVIGVGRVMALFNHFLFEKVTRTAGVRSENEQNTM